MERVPCPVPDYAITDKFTYLHPSDIKAGNVTEEYGIDVDRIKLNQRAPNDFCPRTQVKLLMKECGEPKLQVTEHQNEDGSISYTTADDNHTMDTVKEKLPDCILKYCGEDLKDEVYEYVENEYLKLVQMAIKKQENLQLREEEDAKGVLDIDWESIITSSKLDTLKVSHLNLYLIDIIGKTLAQIKKTGYLKKDKILDILAHFYTR